MIIMHHLLFTLHPTTFLVLLKLDSHLKAPPDAVKMIRLSAPSGNPWIHCREIYFKYQKLKEARREHDGGINLRVQEKRGKE